MEVSIWAAVILTAITVIIFVVIPVLAVVLVISMALYFTLFFFLAWMPFILIYLTIILGSLAFLWVYLD